MVISPQFALDRNLSDAGCDDTTSKAVRELLALGKRREGILLLRQHRKKLLDDVHAGQKRIDALDYLLFRLCHDAGKPVS